MKRTVVLALILTCIFFANALAAVSPIPSTNPPSSAPVSQTSSYLQSVKTLQENKYSENEIKSFIYQVFGMFDRHPDVNQLLLMFADEDLDMRVPEGTIKSHDDFKKWYAGVGARFQSNIHAIDKIEISIPSKGDYRASFIVNWQAMGRDGKYVSLKFRQTWRIADGGGYWPRIVSYVVEPAY